MDGYHLYMLTSKFTCEDIGKDSVVQSQDEIGSSQTGCGSTW